MSKHCFSDDTIDFFKCQDDEYKILLVFPQLLVFY